MNFAAIDQLPHLRSYLGERGRVSQAVEREIQKHSRNFPHLDEIDITEWFGTAIRVKGKASAEAVDKIRRFQFGGEESEPLRHLGESETIHLLTTDREQASSTMLTEDIDAYNISVGRSIVTKSCRDVFETLVARHEISSADALSMMIDIRDSPLQRGIMNMPETAAALEP